MADIADCNTAKCRNLYEFYKDSTVLITGGTGFLGKVLVEKLLRCFSVKCIYLLIRNKNNKSTEMRKEEYFMETIFNRLREQSSSNDWQSKVKAINVDYNVDDLDIDKTMQKTIISQVNIVFNIVASVKFNENLIDAVNINIIGTKRVLDLVEQIQHLKSFVHISTLYSNCHLKDIKETVYKSSISCAKFLEIVHGLGAENLEKFKKCLLQGMPNTYTLTKRYSEELVEERSRYLAAGIFRPPILMSTYRQPFSGWTDNLYGPAGIGVGAARGFIHCIHGDPGKVANLVPVDYCVNALVAVAWDVNRKRFGINDKLPVYNYIYRKNNLTWGQYMEMIPRGFHEPLERCLWYYSYTIVKQKWLFNLVATMVHTIPGYILDVCSVISGRERKFSNIYQKIHRLLCTMSHFGLQEWNFENDNIVDLSRELKRQGLRTFEFDLTTLNWNEYFESYMPGIKKYYLKESDDRKELAKVRYSRLKCLHHFMKTFFWIIFYSQSFITFLNLFSKYVEKLIFCK